MLTAVPSRLQVAKIEASQAAAMECVSAVSRHWKALTGELNAAKQRIGGASTAVPPGEEVAKVFEGILELSKAVTEPVSGIDSTLSEACGSVKALMIEVAQAVEQANAKHAQGIAELAAGGDDAIKAKLGEVVKEMEGKDKLLDEMRAKLRALEDAEATRADEVATAKGRVSELSERLEETRLQLETADRRLAKSEGRYRVLENQYKNAPKAEAGSTAGGAGAGAGAGDGGKLAAEEAGQRRDEFKIVADKRLEEIKGCQREIVALQLELEKAKSVATPGGAGGGKLSQSQVESSTWYVALADRMEKERKECETHHGYRIKQLEAEVIEGQRRIMLERQALEEQHRGQVQMLQDRFNEAASGLDKAKQEVRSLTMKIEEGKLGGDKGVREVELDELIIKVRKEYDRLKADNEALRAKPDAEQVGREYRDNADKLQKERDVEAGKVADLEAQLVEKDKLLEQIKASGGGVSGDSVVAVELEAVKKELEGVRNEKKDLARRYAKADRGFTDVMKLLKTTKREKETLMKDLESIGASFEEMQEQNVRLLTHMKGREEEANEALRQRMKDKQNREMLVEERLALKDKVAKLEEFIKAKTEVGDEGRGCARPAPLKP